MPEANATKRNDDSATMSTRTSYESKLPVQTWNRSNSINVTYIPLIERHNNGFYTNVDGLIENASQQQCPNDQCNLNSSNNYNLCCCSQRTSDPNPSSCWHSKRKQIIRQSSHASEIAASLHSTKKKSISLPATPNLSQLRRPVRSTYTKLNDLPSSSSSCAASTTPLNLHMPLTYEQFLKTPQFREKFTATTTRTSSIESSLSNNSLAPQILNKSSTTRSMLLKHNSTRYEDTSPYTTPVNTISTITTSTITTNVEQISNINNNNNNNATMCANLVMVGTKTNNNKMSKSAGCFIQKASYENEDEQANPKFTSTSNKHNNNTSNTPRGGLSGGFLRCEHCCESIENRLNNIPPNNGLKSTSLNSDHYQRSDSETVSELSSYRFVTDEDIGIQPSNTLSLRNTKEKRLTECVNKLNVENDKCDDNDLIENTTYDETNNFKNKYENQSDRIQIDLDHLHQQQQQHYNNNNKTSRINSVQTPTTNCCYTIDKSNSDQFIPYNNNNNTKPVSIPQAINVTDLNPNDNLLSSSLPRNYGSNFDTCSFTRQLYIRNSLRSHKPGPPVPPKPLTDATEEPSYDPQRFYRKLQKFEKQTTLIQHSLPREIPTRSQERSITPERCELLNCFPSYRNRSNSQNSQNSKEIHNNTEIQQIENQVESEQEIINSNNNINTCKNGHLSNNSNNNSNYKCKIGYGPTDYQNPKRTLRYDNQGRLKSSFLSQLPVTNYRRASWENDNIQNVKLTPTLTRKFNYSPKHTITAEINEETEEEIANCIKQTKQINNELLNFNNGSDNFIKTSENYENSIYKPKEELTTTSPLQSPTATTSLSRCNQPTKKSHSSPIVGHHDALSSPVWLSTETIESHASSSQKCLDEIQSNCSDQTTIFHFEYDNSTSSSPLSQLYGGGGPHNFSTTNNGGNFFKGPLLVKRLPAIQSFGYIPQHSSSLGSANVREDIEKEITMEKRRNTLDRFQRLGFGRKSAPNTANSNASSNSAEASGSSKNRKSNEKTEKLRELTELLRVGGGNRSSPTPPPVPPPRKPRSCMQSPSSVSCEKTDLNEISSSTPPTSMVLSSSTETSEATEPVLSFMSTHTDDIQLMDQDEQTNNNNTSNSTNNLQKLAAEQRKKGAAEQKVRAQLKVNNVTDSKHTTAARTPLSSPTLKTNASLSNLELLIEKQQRENSKSPPPIREHVAVAAAAAEDDIDGDAECNDSLSSTHIATKLDKPESRTIIGSYCQKSIPFRSASFSAIDYSAGKYKKSALSALRDRLRRDKAVESTSPTTSIFNSMVDNLTWPRKKLEEEAAAETTAKKEPDWIYIPLKQKSENSISLCYGQDKALEDVMESPDIIPEEEVFMADTVQEVPDKVEAACVATMVAAHAKMESLTDTIQSENDYIIDESQLPVTVDAKDLQEARSDSMTECMVEQNSTRNPLNDIFEPNLATLMEEQIPLESPPDNILQTATTCLIPVPVYECAAQEWGLENPPQEWVEATPEKFDIIPETIEPLGSLEHCQVDSAESKIQTESLPTISVSRSSDELEDNSILRKKEENDGNSIKSAELPMERRQASLDGPEVKKRYSHDDLELITEKRSSLDNITTRHSSDERRKADMSIRRKGIYIENWHEPTEGSSNNAKSLALDITIANLNAIKPDSTDDNIMYINSPLTDDNRTPASLYSFDLNTPEAECQNTPVWVPKHPLIASLSLQSSEEKDDIPLASPPVSLSTSHISLPRQHKSYPFLRTDSISDNESDRTTPPSRDRTSPALSENDFKRFSKRPLRGPYGQMLEAEMKKPNKMHFEEILEDLRESDVSIQPRRQRSIHDDAGGRSNMPHYSNSMRVRKTANSTYLPVPQHTRAASTPSQIENVSSSGSRNGANEHDDDDDDMIIKIKPLEKKYQSSLDTTTIGRDDIITAPPTPLAPVTTTKTKTSSSSSPSPLMQREQQRASSEAPVSKSHSKRSQSMSSTEKSSNAHLQHLHQQKRSLDVTSNNKICKNNPTTATTKAGGTSGQTSNSTTTTNILPTPELLAQLLKGSSEKLLSEQRQQMYAFYSILSFLWILDEIGETFKSTSISLAVQLAATLRFFAEGSFQRSVGNDVVIAMHRTTFSKSFSKMLSILENILCKNWIILHTDPIEIQKSRRHFSDKFRIPGVIGCIDGTHIEIVKPGPQDHLFYNRKGYYSINAMIICDYKMRITAVDATRPGASHDSFIWNLSPQRDYYHTKYENGERGLWLLGDSGYALEPILLTPYRDPSPGSIKHKFNRVHTSARNIIERTIGVLKSRFRCLQRTLWYKPQKAVKIINVCCALHNMCIFFNVEQDATNDNPIIEEPNPDEVETLSTLNNEAVRIRDNIAESLSINIV